MMTELEKLIGEMKEKYGKKVVAKTGGCKREELEQIPLPLQELYSVYREIEFPFGVIYPWKTAKRISGERGMFRDGGWFCFGFDGYFSYWLCNYHADEDGLWISVWDHEADEEIEYVYTDLVEFLRDVEAEYA